MNTGQILTFYIWKQLKISWQLTWEWCRKSRNSIKVTPTDSVVQSRTWNDQHQRPLVVINLSRYRSKEKVALLSSNYSYSEGFCFVSTKPGPGEPKNPIIRNDWRKFNLLKVALSRFDWCQTLRTPIFFLTDFHQMETG